MTDVNVRIGQLTFWGGAGIDGFYMAKGGLKGFLDGVGVRAPSIDIPGGHGEFDLPVFRSGRIVSISGPCIATTESVWFHRNRAFTGLMNTGASERVYFDTADGNVLWGNARLADAPKWEPVQWGLRADYLLQLKFADPRLYGKVNQAGPLGYSVAAFHYGNFPAFPIIEVHGYNASGGYTITGPDGKKFIVTQGLFGGDVHRIDMRTGKLTKNGVLQIGAVSRADLWTVPPGTRVGHKISNAASDATTDIRVFTTDTYL